MPRQNYKKKSWPTKEDARLRQWIDTRNRVRRYRERQDGVTRHYLQEIVSEETIPLQLTWSQPASPPLLPQARQTLSEPARWAESATGAEPVIPQDEESADMIGADSLETTLSIPGRPQETQDTIIQQFCDGITSDPLNATLSAPSDLQDLFEDCPPDEFDSQSSTNTNGDSPVITLVDQESKDTNPPTVEWLAAELAKVRLSSNCSILAVEKMLRLFISENDKIMYLYRQGKMTSSYKNSVRLAGIKTSIEIRCAVTVRETQMLPDNHHGRPEKRLCDRVFEERDLLTIPKKYFQPDTVHNYLILCQEAYVKLTAIKAHFKSTHQRLTSEQLNTVFKNAIFGIDGVKESQKSSRKLVIITLQLGGCLYPWRIYNPMKGEKECSATAEEQIRPCVNEILQDPDIRVKMVLADKVERLALRCLPGVTGRYSCEFCLCPGMGLTGGWPFPFGTKYPNRNSEEFKEIARHVRGIPHDRINRRETQGILGYSPLHDLPELDIVWKLPLDEFHLCREGITKLMMLRIFVQCKKPQAIDAFKRVNRVFTTMKVFSECPRRTRTLARLPDFKGNELLVVTMTLMPYIVRHGITENSGIWMFKRKAMVIYTFLTRLYFYNDARLADVEGVLGDLKFYHKKFYKFFQLGFAIPYKKTIPPNVHSFWHLLESRKQTGPLWKTSTESFESMYSVVRRSFKPGTPNCPKQILENYYMRDKFKHRCRRNNALKVQPDRKSSKYSDSWVKTSDGLIWKINEQVSDFTVRCSLVKTAKFSTNDMNLRLPWDMVGISKFVKIEEGATTLIHVDAISSKVMKCRNILADWKPEWLMDSKCDY